ncbi:FecR family protein [Achromobacter pestifer]
MTPEIDRQAVQWMLRLNAGNTDAAEQLRFQQWREADPAHAQAWTLLQESVAGPLQALRTLGAAHTQDAASAALRGILVRGPSRRLFLGKTLTLAAAATGAGWIGARQWQQRGDLVTGTAERRTVQLDDGSRLQLNADSRIRLEFNSAVRRVRLLQGAVIATVTPDESRPFGVSTNDGTAWALGTRYMVRKEAEQSVAAVLEHTVRVRSRSGATEQLVEGQAAAYDANGIRRLDGMPATALAAWEAGRIDVLDASLEDVAAALRPYMRGTLHLTTAAARLRVQGVFSLDRPDEAWAALAATLPLRINRYGGLLTWVDHA